MPSVCWNQRFDYFNYSSQPRDIRRQVGIRNGLEHAANFLRRRRSGRNQSICADGRLLRNNWRDARRDHVASPDWYDAGSPTPPHPQCDTIWRLRAGDRETHAIRRRCRGAFPAAAADCRQCCHAARASCNSRGTGVQHAVGALELLLLAQLGGVVGELALAAGSAVAGHSRACTSIDRARRASGQGQRLRVRRAYRWDQFKSHGSSAP